MAGLVAAARARQLRLSPVVYEKGSRVGGSMLLSSCVIWRYRSLEDFRRECPGGDERLQRAVVERLDEALAWLESLGAEPVWRATGNPLTLGRRYEPSALTDVLVRAAGGGVHIGKRAEKHAAVELPTVLATGGFSVRYAREHGLLVRSNPWSEGEGIELALQRGAATTAGMDEFYGRNMPAPPARIREEDYVPLAQLYGRHALVLNDDGEAFFDGDVSWSETDLVQATARQRNARAWYVVGDDALAQPVRDGTVRDLVEAARTAGGAVVAPFELPFATPEWARVAVRVMPGVTHTIGGVRVDERARVLDDDGATIDGLYAAGADVGGISNGGYASGLAAALVFGLAAAESLAS